MLHRLLCCCIVRMYLHRAGTFHGEAARKSWTSPARVLHLLKWAVRFRRLHFSSAETNGRMQHHVNRLRWCSGIKLTYCANLLCSRCVISVLTFTFYLRRTLFIWKIKLETLSCRGSCSTALFFYATKHLLVLKYLVVATEQEKFSRSWNSY